MRISLKTTINFALLLSFILFSCSPTNTLTIGVTEPAPVYMPTTINKIGIINRSLSTDNNEKIDNLDKIFTLEGKELDKNGALESIKGLKEQLTKNEKINDIKLIEYEDVNNMGGSNFPSKLSWEDIEKICQANEVDGIFELAFYDTDTKVDYEVKTVQLDGPLGIKIPVIENHVTVTTFIKTGWHIYDPINKVVRDEFLMNETLINTGKGINPAKAIEAIRNRKEDVLQNSNNMGHSYALRIVPYHTRVKRQYYVRGSESLKIAKRRAQTGNWKGAGELWETENLSPKKKVASRACYNMAIISEINGDLNLAIEWAAVSYTDYGNKLALKYLDILKYRVYKNEQLKKQQEE